MKIKLNQTQADLITALLQNVILSTGDIYADAAYELMEKYPEIFGRECDEIPVKVKFPKHAWGERSIKVTARLDNLLGPGDKIVDQTSAQAWPFVTK